MRNVDSAFTAAEMNEHAVVLLGIEPEKAETSYGWIEPARSFFGDVDRAFSRVDRFWEKPSLSVAKRLMASGSLWNSFVMIGKVSTFLEMFRQHLPGLYRMFLAAERSFGTAQEDSTMRSIYNWIEDTNFSSQVLERSAANLFVMRVGNVGWSDWGEPQRVMCTLNNLGVRTEWMQALAA
jgi:mannose-1-phosphate guanylyltransferase